MRSGTLASILADEAIVASMVPFPCPSDFGPEGRYRLEELISAGGRSLVYRATDKRLSSQGFDARVAVKIFRGASVPQEEALATRRINHPNVLGILDRGVQGDAPYMVSEYVDGGDLSAKPGPWPSRDAARFMAKVCRGVQAAHSAGIIHCDLKPANILLTDGGEPKLADFEMSRWTDRGDNASRGNAAFMSPEQFRGEPDGLTPPSDVYALGGLLFWLLTGKLPNGSTTDEVLARHSALAPAPAPGIDADLDRICTRAMAPMREDRYYSAGDLANDLERWTRHEPLPWAGAGLVRRTRLWVRRHPIRSAGTAAAAVAVVSVLSAWQYSAAQAREQKARTQAESVRLANQKVEEIKARVRAHIEFMAKATLVDHPTDLQDRVLPALVWLNWLSDFAVITNDGPVPTVSERVNLLRSMVVTSDAEGRRGQFDDALARYSLAYFLTEQGESAEAVNLLRQIRELWGARLPAQDVFWVSVDGVEACARANLAVANGERAEAAASLRALVAALEKDGHSEPVRRLAQRLLMRAQAKSR